MTQLDRCLLCGRDNETLIHVLRDCKWAKCIWKSFKMNGQPIFCETKLVKSKPAVL